MTADKKKIIYIITKSVWGGAQRYVFDLATNLPHGEWDILVVTGGNGILVQKLSQENIRVEQIKELERDINFFSDFKIFWKIFSILRSEKPNIAHLNSSKIGIIGSLAAWLYNITAKNHEPRTKIIFTAHGWAWNEERSWWQKKLIVLSTRFAAALQDIIIILSRNDLASTLYYKIPEKKLAVIPLGIKPPKFLHSLEGQKLLMEKIGKINRPLIGTIAEFTRNKGLRYLIQALHKLHQQKLIFSCAIIGDGEKRGHIEKLAKELGLDDVIKFVGFMDNAAKYIKTFDVFVLPSTKEGLPYVLLEALFAEIPIIATNVGGITDIVEHGSNGIIVPPQNPSMLASAIKKLALNEELLKKFSQNSKRKSSAFSFEPMLAKTISVYREEA